MMKKRSKSFAFLKRERPKAERAQAGGFEVALECPGRNAE